MALQLLLETTIVQRETRSSVAILFVPSEALQAADMHSDDAPAALGLSLGVPVTSAPELQDVMYASLSGRVVPFDQGSFDRWRPQRLEQSGSPRSAFAEQLVVNDLVPVASSPIRGTSLAHLLAQGSAWTASAAEAITHDPIHGLGVLVVCLVNR
jgi:hypothetical protein